MYWKKKNSYKYATIQRVPQFNCVCEHLLMCHLAEKKKCYNRIAFVCVRQQQQRHILRSILTRRSDGVISAWNSKRGPQKLRRKNKNKQSCISWMPPMLHCAKMVQRKCVFCLTNNIWLSCFILLLMEIIDNWW